MTRLPDWKNFCPWSRPGSCGAMECTDWRWKSKTWKKIWPPGIPVTRPFSICRRRLDRRIITACAGTASNTRSFTAVRVIGFHFSLSSRGTLPHVIILRQRVAETRGSRDPTTAFSALDCRVKPGNDNCAPSCPDLIRASRATRPFDDELPIMPCHDAGQKIIRTTMGQAQQ